MREILFRGKRTDNGEWVYGSLIDGIYGVAPVIVTQPSMDDDFQLDFEYDHVDPTTVGQFTGLKDKNGKRIFEGDIVKTDKFSEPNKQYIIKYDLQFGAFIGQDRYNVYFVTFDSDSGEFEVIGNVTDNPDLLEK